MPVKNDTRRCEWYHDGNLTEHFDVISRSNILGYMVGEAVAEVFGEIEFLRHVSRLRVGGASGACDEVTWHSLRWS